jgi:hypothetical protein
VSLTVVRRGEARTVDIVLAADPGHAWHVSVSPAATRAQSAHLDTWVRQ